MTSQAPPLSAKAILGLRLRPSQSYDPAHLASHTCLAPGFYLRLLLELSYLTTPTCHGATPTRIPGKTHCAPYWSL